MADISQLSDEQLISLLQQTEPERPPASAFESRFTDVTGYLNPKQLGDTPKEILDTAVAEGLISPTYTPPEDATDEFSTAWRAYQQEMAPSAAGAALRGATRAIIPTLGGIAGGAIGSVVPVPGAAIVGGMAGAAAGSELQEKMMPMSTEEQAQAQFDIASAGTRLARAGGELVPQLLVARPAVSTARKALAGDVAAAKSLAVGAGFGAGTSLAGSAARGELPDLERLAFDTITGAALEPSRLGQKLFDRTARQEIAAQQAATNVMGRFVKNKEQAITRLEAAGELAGEGVRPLSGDVVGDENFIGLQQALRNRDRDLANIDQASAEALAKGVDVALERSAVNEMKANEYFIAKNEELLTRAQATYDSLIQRGDIDSANILRQAEENAVKAIQRAELGVQTPEVANAIIANQLERAQGYIASRLGDRTDPGEVVFKSLQSEQKKEQAVAEAKFKELDTAGITTTFEKGRAAADAIRSDIPEMDALPTKVKDFIQSYKGEDRPASELIRVLQSVSGAISEQSGPGGNRNTARLLGVLKKGVESDLAALGDLYADVKDANAVYKIYADKYLNDVTGNVLKGGVYPSESIKAHATAPEALQQLKSAINESPAAIKAINDWVYLQMLDAIRGNPTAKSIQNWVDGETGRRLLNAFPEVYEAKIAPELASLIKAEFAQNKAKEKLAEVKEQTQKELKEVKEKQFRATEQRQKLAESDLQNQKQQIQASQAAVYVGAAPEIAIGKVINGENPVANMQELVNRASQDLTGNAIEGLKNALKNYLNTVLRRTGEEATTENAIKPLQKADLALSFDNLNKYFVEGGLKRSAIEVLLGKDSKELQALDKTRRQVALYARRRRAAGGQSVTNLYQAMEASFETGIAENTLSVLGRLTSSVMPMELKRVTGVMSDLTDVFRTMWRGDVAKKAQGMLVNAMIDPQAAIELLRPLDKQSLPRIKSWLRVYPQSGASLPFNEINTDEQQLPSGTVTTDNFTGYRIVQTGKNSFKLYNDRKQLEGIFTSGNDARRAAVRKAFGSK